MIKWQQELVKGPSLFIDSLPLDPALGEEEQRLTELISQFPSF